MKINGKQRLHIMLYIWLYRVGFQETSFYFCKDGLRSDSDVIKSRSQWGF